MEAKIVAELVEALMGRRIRLQILIVLTREAHAAAKKSRRTSKRAYLINSKAVFTVLVYCKE